MLDSGVLTSADTIKFHHLKLCTNIFETLALLKTLLVTIMELYAIQQPHSKHLYIHMNYGKYSATSEPLAPTNYFLSQKDLTFLANSLTITTRYLANSIPPSSSSPIHPPTMSTETPQYAISPLPQQEHTLHQPYTLPTPTCLGSKRALALCRTSPYSRASYRCCFMHLLLVLQLQVCQTTSTGCSFRGEMLGACCFGGVPTS